MTTWTWILIATSMTALLLWLRENRLTRLCRLTSDRMLDEKEALHAFARRVGSLNDRASIGHLLEKQLHRLFPTTSVRIVVRDTMQRQRSFSRAAEVGRGASWVGALCTRDHAFGVLEIEAAAGEGLSPRAIQLFELFAHIAAAAMESHEADDSSSSSHIIERLLDREEFYARSDAEIHRAERHQSQCSLLLLDFDDLQQMNRRNGVRAVRAYFHGVFRRVRSRLRTFDLVAQLGGHEFGILLPETDRQKAKQIADRLLAGIADCVVECDGVPLRTTATIGVSTFPGDGGANLSLLLRRAEESRYRARKKQAS